VNGGDDAGTGAPRERPLDRQLADEVATWRAAGLERRLPRDDGRARADFVSNDYLGLACDRRVVDAARAALERAGAGARAARLLGGGSERGDDAARAEELCAEWLGEEAALLFPSGWQANLGAIGTLAGPGDALFSDELNHASLIDGCRLSRARVATFAHGDLDELARQLAQSRGARRRLVVVESLFSMDGDLADLAALDELAARHDAWLLVDEAHAAGLLGPRGAGGFAATRRPATRVAARIVTGGKALGVAGAFVVGSAALRDLLLHRARPFVFTTAPPPAVSAALAAAITIVREPACDATRARLLALARALATALPRGATAARPPAGAIVPFQVGDAAATRTLGDALDRDGFAVGAVRPPTVPEGGARLRLVVHATNTDDEIARLAAAIARHAPARAGAAAAATAATAATARTAAAPRLAEPWFVVGTDTGVGKTVVSALLLRAAKRTGPAAYWKPVQTGSESDSATVAALAAIAPHEQIAPHHAFARPASPHEAAAEEGRRVERLDEALAAHRARLAGHRLIVELAGGLLVPYRAGREPWLQADWLARLRPRIVVVARTAVGTLNHTLLTLEALRARRLEPTALFLVGEPHPWNAATLRELSGVEALFELPRLEPLATAALDHWLDRDDRSAGLAALLAPERLR